MRALQGRFDDALRHARHSVELVTRRRQRAHAGTRLPHRRLRRDEPGALRRASRIPTGRSRSTPVSAICRAWRPPPTTSVATTTTPGVGTLQPTSTGSRVLPVNASATQSAQRTATSTWPRSWSNRATTGRRRPFSSAHSPRCDRWEISGGLPSRPAYSAWSSSALQRSTTPPSFCGRQRRSSPRSGRRPRPSTPKSASSSACSTTVGPTKHWHWSTRSSPSTRRPASMNRSSLRCSAGAATPLAQLGDLDAGAAEVHGALLAARRQGAIHEVGLALEALDHLNAATGRETPEADTSERDDIIGRLRLQPRPAPPGWPAARSAELEGRVGVEQDEVLRLAAAGARDLGARNR